MLANVLVSTENMNQEEWLQWRKKGIGGSDASAVCGLNRWKSPVEVWLEKTNQMEPTKAGEAAYWGTMLEQIVREEFTKRTSLPVQQFKAILQHPDYPFMLANLDGLVDDPHHGLGIFEAKTAGEYASKDWEDGLPDEYALQVQHYLAVTGFKFAYVAVLIGGSRFQWQFITRNETVIHLLYQLESRFWKLVESNSSPPFDGSKASTELLNHLYPQGKANSELNLPPEAEDLITAYETASEEEKTANVRKEKAPNKLKALIGEYEAGRICDRKVCWKTITSERFDSKKLKAEAPDIYNKYIFPTTYRRFSVK